MNLNCTVCSNPIDKTRGYYLVMGAPQCIDCYQPRKGACDIGTFSQQQEPESLLDEFRAYQKRSNAAACRNY